MHPISPADMSTFLVLIVDTASAAREPTKPALTALPLPLPLHQAQQSTVNSRHHSQQYNRIVNV